MEATILENSRAINLDKEIGLIAGSSKSGIYDQLADSIEKSYKNYNKAYKHISGFKAGDDKNGLSYLRNYKNPNMNLAYNIGLCSILSKPENRDIIALQNVLSNYYMDLEGADTNKTTAYNTVKEELFNYLKESGIMEGIKSFDDLPELINRMESPEFQKGFTKAAKNAYTKQMEKYQSTIRENAKEQALIDKEAGKKMRSNRLKKVAKEASANRAKTRLTTAKNEAKRKAFNKEMTELINEYHQTEVLSDKLLSKFKYKDPARFRAFYDKALANPKTDLYNINVTEDDINKAREKYNLNKPAAEIAAEKKAAEAKKNNEKKWKERSKKIVENKNPMKK